MRSNDVNIKGNSYRLSNNQYKTNELDENNYIKTNTNSGSFETEAIIELKDIISSKYTEMNQK